MPQRVTLDALNRSAPAEFVRLLDGIFEDAPWIVEQAAAHRPFGSVSALQDALMNVVLNLPADRQTAFIAGHPDLAGKAARAGTIASASVAEQAGLGLDRLSDDDFVRFEGLNTAYRRKFGFPFVICVRRQTRDAVLDAFERRLASDVAAELHTALAEIAFITRLRLAERVEGTGMPSTTGRLSTHVLDTYHGRSAAGVAIDLFEIGRSARARLLDARTNGDGRTDKPLISDCPLRIGTYELLFHVGDYFRASGIALPIAPFLDVVVIRFGISEPEGHYHIPLVTSPSSYSTYRGS